MIALDLARCATPHGRVAAGGQRIFVTSPAPAQFLQVSIRFRESANSLIHSAAHDC
jgi:hypothetical protein